MTQKKNRPEEIIIHTDGACLGNPGPGGYAAVLRRFGEDGNEIKSRRITGGEPLTTNNRMEMTAAIHGLRQIKVDECGRIKVFSDSQLLIKGMTEWLPKWQAKNWRGSTGKEVANKDLWLALVALCERKHVKWCWVRGHNGDPMNEEADRLAKAAASKAAAKYQTTAA